MKRAYTTSEAAEVCGVSRGTVLRWIREKKLHASATFGGHHRIDEPDLVVVLKKLGMKIPANLSFGAILPASTVLIVDDDEEVRRWIRRYLSKKFPALQIQEASDGFSAGIKIQKHRPEMIVLDIMLPGIGGEELCAAIRKLSPEYQPAILAITAHQKKWEERILRAGADGCLQKPLSVQALIRAMRKLWNRPREIKQAG